MTGEKNRYKTHEQLWKLEDGELSTPQHDELVLHLLNKNNINSVLDLLDIQEYENLYSFSKKEHVKNDLINIAKQKLDDEEFIKQDEMERLSAKLDLSVEDFINKTESYIKSVLDDNEHNTVISQIRSEVPIKSETNFIIGYVDVQVVIKSCYISSVCGPETSYDVEFLKTVHDVSFLERIHTGTEQSHEESVNYTTKLSSLIKTYHCIPKFTRYNGKSAWKNPDEDFQKINIEVKPKIKSFGETLRQINTYKEYDKGSMYVIYSPDTRFKAAFESQGITFITPDDLGIKMY